MSNLTYLEACYKHVADTVDLYNIDVDIEETNEYIILTFTTLYKDSNSSNWILRVVGYISNNFEGYKETTYHELISSFRKAYYKKYG